MSVAFEIGYNDGFNRRRFDDPYVEGTNESNDYFQGYCAGEDIASSLYEI